MSGLALNYRVALATAVIGVFLLLFFTLVFTYSFPENTPVFLKVFLLYHFEYMILMVGLGVVAGAVVYKLMSEEVASATKESQLNAELALSLLGTDERKAVKLLLDRRGECLQAEVSRLEGMNRLKAHRVANSLSQRGVVVLDKRGKTVVVRLADNVRQALLAA